MDCMTKDECREKVEACADHGTLTKWESSFLVNLTDQLDRGRPLSDRQQEILTEIHEKIGGKVSRWR
jgi:hypothetical protein